MKTLELEHTSDEFHALVDDLPRAGEIVIVKNDCPIAKLVPLTKALPKVPLKAGCLKGFVMSPDFDEPLEEFKDYM